MNLTDIIKVDKTVNKPNIVEQVVSQITDLIESGELPEDIRILPSYEQFSKELGITRINGCRIYDRLKKYGGYDKNGNLLLDGKRYALQQLQESVKYAIKQGATFGELIKVINDNYECEGSAK